MKERWVSIGTTGCGCPSIYINHVVNGKIVKSSNYFVHGGMSPDRRARFALRCIRFFTAVLKRQMEGGK
jgi:hypothetical protein